MSLRFHFSNGSRRALALLAVVALVLLPGCVRRRLLVRTNPPGAAVYVDNQLIGTTPCATSFVYYGTREIRMVKPGYETLTINQPIPAPWFEFPGVDFVSENVVPNDINDYRTVTYTLQPQIIHPTEQIIARGEQLRAGTQGGAVVPAGTAVSPATPLLSAPTIATPGAAPPGAVLAPETLGPGLIVPPSSGAGVLPPGGQPLEPLPAPQ